MMVDLLVAFDYSPGDEVIKEGVEGDSMYIVAGGDTSESMLMCVFLSSSVFFEIKTKRSSMTFYFDMKTQTHNHRGICDRKAFLLSPFRWWALCHPVRPEPPNPNQRWCVWGVGHPVQLQTDSDSQRSAICGFYVGSLYLHTKVLTPCSCMINEVQWGPQPSVSLSRLTILFYVITCITQCIQQVKINK